MLAGLVKSPSSYAPTVSLERAVARRNVVLQAMLESGAINRTEWQAARSTKTALRDTLRAGGAVRAVLQGTGAHRARRALRLAARLSRRPARVHDHQHADAGRRRIGRRRADSGDRGESAPHGRRAARRLERKGPSAPPPRADRSRCRPRSSRSIRRAATSARWSADAKFDASHFNRAVQAHRQPGSAFKPFVYATALEAGFTPATMIEHLNDPIATLQGAWTPEDEHSSAESMSLRAGLRMSSNRAAVRLLQEVGIGRTVQYAKTMGVGDVPSVPSLALGSGEVTLQSMTAAYAAFANHGLVPAPMLIRRVEDNEGRLLYAAQESSTRAITDITAFLMSTMLADVINAGTAQPGAAAGVHAAGGRQDRHHQRFQRRVVRRLHAQARDGRVGRVRSAAHDSAERVRRRRRGAGVGEVHEGRHGQRQAGMVPGAVRRHDRQRLPPLRETGDGRVRGRRGRRQERRARSASRWFTPSTSTAAPNRRPTANCTRRAASWASSPGSSAHGKACTSPHPEHRRSAPTPARPPRRWRWRRAATSSGSNAAAGAAEKEARVLVQIFGRGKDDDSDEVQEAAAPKKKGG